MIRQYFIIYIWRFKRDFDERRLLEGWPSVRDRNQWKSDLLFRGPPLAGLFGYWTRLPLLVLVTAEESVLSNVRNISSVTARHSDLQMFFEDVLAEIRSPARERLTVLT